MDATVSGSKFTVLRKLVDLTGIEPVTSSMPWKRAPGCATGPLSGRTLTILRVTARIVNFWVSAL